MSSYFMEDSFPDLTELLRTRYEWLWYHIFPLHLQAECPEMQYILQDYKIRSPYLIPIALAAAICGVMGFVRNRQSKTLAFCRAGCLFFGLMNISAIGLHCLFDRQTMAWKVAQAVDMCCTGCAALLLTLGMYLRNGHRHQGILITLIVTSICGGYGAGTALSLPYVNEVTYLGITVVSSALVALLGRTNLLEAAEADSYALACVGAVIALVCLSLDRYLCRAFGSYVNLSHVLFFGCLVIVFYLERYMVRVAHKAKIM